MFFVFFEMAETQLSCKSDWLRRHNSTGLEVFSQDIDGFSGDTPVPNSDKSNEDKIKDKVKEYNEINKDKIKTYQIQYHETNKDKISKQKKEYRETNKDKINKQKKEYYEKNKDIINSNRNIKINCKWGGKYTHVHKLRHFKTIKHTNYINNN